VKYGRTRVDDREEGGEVQRAEDADKADVFLVAVCDGAALDGEKDVRICCGGGIVDHRTGRVVERLDREVGEIPPVIIEATAPVKYEAVNDGTAVELGAKGIEEDARVDGDELDGTASDLKRVGTLEDGHRRINLGVNIRRVATNWNQDQVARDERHSVVSNGARRGGRNSHRRWIEGENLVMEHHLRNDSKRVSRKMMTKRLSRKL